MGIQGKTNVFCDRVREQEPGPREREHHSCGDSSSSARLTRWVNAVANGHLPDSQRALISRFSWFVSMMHTNANGNACILNRSPVYIKGYYFILGIMDINQY